MTYEETTCAVILGYLLAGAVFYGLILLFELMLTKICWPADGSKTVSS